MTLLAQFFDPDHPSLKVCGITSEDDATRLVRHGVAALGVNFWPRSKRYCDPAEARVFLPSLAGQILRVGVFVNNARELAPGLLADNSIDAVQLHGDETLAELAHFLELGVPTIRAVALTPEGLPSGLVESLAESSTPSALLLDAHAPGVYGGTGRTIDWEAAAQAVQDCLPIPVFLAGGIKPENARRALEVTRPAGLDVASGSESAPGVKDFGKVSELQALFHTQP
ncbi:MAG: phosphoribosylanthranilate isomerase [Verrucomicrobiota bacterium JB023]|nr:phosphoribosylanthranilate isomerase [Verrucomicrobiota bacterium JB023]